MARYHLRPHPDLRSQLEVEDLVNEAALRLTRQAIAGRLVDRVRCHDDFWPLLHDVLRECIRKKRRRLAAIKRGGAGTKRAPGREDRRSGDSGRPGPALVIVDDLDSIASRERSPEVVVWTRDLFQRLLERLDDGQAQVARLRLSGLSVPEIAREIGGSERTVARRLEEIRDIGRRSGLLDE